MNSRTSSKDRRSAAVRRGRNIFLAEAMGAIGWWLVSPLRDAGDAVTGTTRSREKVVVLGTDLALHSTVATMVSQMPVTADELAIAGGLSGAALPVVKAVTQDFLVPAEAEFVLEGQMLIGEEEVEGPVR